MMPVYFNFWSLEPRYQFLRAQFKPFYISNALRTPSIGVISNSERHLLVKFRTNPPCVSRIPKNLYRIPTGNGHSESIAIWCSPEPTWSRFLERPRTLIGNDDIFPRDGKGRSQNFESDAMKSSQPLLLVESSILLVAQVGISTRGV
jgi:hypothetical protein